MGYKEDALAYAQAQGWTWQIVESATYNQVANACAIILGPGGESPTDFFYRNIRQWVSGELRRLKREDKVAWWITKARVQVRKIAGLEGVDVTWNPETKVLTVDVKGLWESL